MITFKKRKIEVINKGASGIIWKCKICYICKDKAGDKHAKDIKYQKIRVIVIIVKLFIIICYLKNSILKEVSVVCHNGSSYDYHFIIKELLEEFEKQFTCLGKNTEKCITLSVPIQKEITRIDTNVEEVIKKIFCKLQFMHSTLSNLVNNLAQRIYKTKCNNQYDNKKYKTWGIKYKDCESFLEYTNLKRWFNRIQMLFLQ